MPLGRLDNHSSPSRPTVISCLAVLIVVLAACIACSAVRAGENASREATLAAEQELTAKYGDLARQSIENFELRWGSLEAHIDPSVLSEVATGSHLRYFGPRPDVPKTYSDPFWIITRSVQVNSVRVLQYTTGRLKAVACVTKLMDEVTPDGAFKLSYPPNRLREVYVFSQVDAVWKLEAVFDITDPQRAPRDWDQSPEPFQQIIGDWPRDVDLQCLPATPVR